MEIQGHAVRQGWMSSLLDNFEGMYSDGDGDVRCYSRRIVVTRAPHKCPGNFLEALHDIPPGTTAVVERAIVDGKWGTCYTCADCIEKWNQ
jgi:hypothetical protein